MTCPHLPPKGKPPAWPGLLLLALAIVALMMTGDHHRPEPACAPTSAASCRP